MEEPYMHGFPKADCLLTAVVNYLLQNLYHSGFHREPYFCTSIYADDTLAWSTSAHR